MANMAIVVADKLNPSADELAYKLKLEATGHTVTFVTDGDDELPGEDGRVAVGQERPAALALAKRYLDKAGPFGGPLFTWADVNLLRLIASTSATGLEIVLAPQTSTACRNLAERLARVLLAREES